MVLADEPVASLDPAMAHEMLRLLTSLAEVDRRALVVSLHSPELTRRFCTLVIRLRRGHFAFDLAAEAVSETILDDPYQLDAPFSETRERDATPIPAPAGPAVHSRIPPPGAFR